MPNCVTNQITFGKEEKDLAEFQRMAESLRMDGEYLGTIDFNKLKPMPAELNIIAGSKTERGLKNYRKYLAESAAISKMQPKVSDNERSDAEKEHCHKWEKIKEEDPESWSLGEKAYQNIRKYGCPTWYEWCIQNWGTKWNAFNCVSLDDKSSTMQFDTAWGDVRELVKMISEKYPKQKIHYRWADEDIGSNVGEIYFYDGQPTVTNIPETQSRAAYELSAEILGVDLAEYNLYLSEDKSNYQYMPDGPVKPKTQCKNKSGREER